MLKQLVAFISVSVITTSSYASISYADNATTYSANSSDKQANYESIALPTPDADQKITVTKRA